MKTWVVSDATGEDAVECDFFHFWTPNGLTRSSGREQLDGAKRAGWKDTIIVRARTHREAMEKAKTVFDRRRRKVGPPPEQRASGPCPPDARAEGREVSNEGGTK